jgi:hypothetical protein
MTTLKNVLYINGISSGATGLLMVLFPTPIAALLNTLPSAVTYVGSFLVVFAALVLYAARQQNTSRKLVSTIVMLDLSWVIASVFVIAGGFQLSGLGLFLIGAVAAWVGLMAILQINGLRRSFS